ncbi:hypothetical protein SKAU_G00216870 [Synaphobranchus kaupii]|uniref:Uncharacterized protein n=1 Tax=Synaphobranchus kaupii TaxID=118154 RepID=A0A9Q1ITG8_SYNKA|nr:hypothetical protein SKAU_G00216870 [Synaphobranchus kaupii]
MVALDARISEDREDGWTVKRGPGRAGSHELQEMPPICPNKQRHREARTEEEEVHQVSCLRISRSPDVQSLSPSRSFD